MRTRTGIVVAALALLVSGCTGGKALPAAMATPVAPSPSASVRPFVAEPFKPAVWPIATTAELQTYRARPTSIPWATYRVAVAEHFARDLLKLRDVHGVARCAPACTDVDLYVEGQHVGKVALAAERDAPATVYSVAGAYTADVDISTTLDPLSDPAVAIGTVRKSVEPLHVSLRNLTGTTLATAAATTPAVGTDWTAVLPHLPKAWGRGVLVVTTSARGKLTRLLAQGVVQQVPVVPAAHVRCQRTDLNIVAPSEFHAGYTGDSSFGFYVANTGNRTCVLNGYASLTFTDGSNIVPFRIVRGSGMGYHDPGPNPVTIGPGGAAVFAVDKYRCDSGSRSNAT